MESMLSRHMGKYGINLHLSNFNMHRHHLGGEHLGVGEVGISLKCRLLLNVAGVGPEILYC